jgi:tripartite ATP-independent transporter DctP family solute receptor
VLHPGKKEKARCSPQDSERRFIMKKLRKWVIWTGIVCFIMLGWVIRCPEASAAQIILRYPGSTQLDHHVTRGQELYAKLVMERTNNRVKVEVYPAGQLFSDKDLTRALPAGSVEMGSAHAGMMSGLAPTLLLQTLPFFYKDYPHWYWSLDSKAGDIVKQEMEEKGNVKFLYWAEYEALNFTSKVPLEKLEDFKGKRIRAPGEMETQAVKSLGAAPAFLGAAEVYPALQRGTVEAVMSGLASFWVRKYFEITKHITLAEVNWGTFPTLINRKVWDGLPKDIQTIFLEAGKETQEWVRKEAEKAQLESLNLLKGKGMVVYQVPEKERERWKQACMPCLEIFSQRVGAERGKNLLDLVGNMR